MTGEKYRELGIRGYLFLLCHWLPTGLWSNCFLSHVFLPCSHFFNYKLSVWVCTDGGTVQFHPTKGTFTKPGRLPLSLTLPVLCCHGVCWDFFRMNISCWNHILFVLGKRNFPGFEPAVGAERGMWTGMLTAPVQAAENGWQQQLALFSPQDSPGHSSPQLRGGSFTWLQKHC